jgi:hypothetical protein
MSSDISPERVVNNLALAATSIRMRVMRMPQCRLLPISYPPLVDIKES